MLGLCVDNNVLNESVQYQWKNTITTATMGVLHSWCRFQAEKPALTDFGSY